jgi:sugar/nucleoside kinase (ribokinase family)
MPHKGHVVVIGDVMTDIIAIPEGPIVRGSDRRATIRLRPGGAGANQAIWLGALGVPVRFVGRVAAADVELQARYFTRFGVGPRLVADPAAASGVLVTLVDPDGERSFLTDRGANLNLSAADLPPDLLDGAGLLLISGYALFAEGPRSAVLAAVQEARARGIACAVDAASVAFLREVGVAQFLAWTAGFDLLFANEEEAETLSGTADLSAEMAALGATYAKVIVKLGPSGAALGGASGVAAREPAPIVDALDTTGAGDAFAAGYLSAHLRGDDDRTALAAGVRAGSFAVTIIGAQPESLVEASRLLG